MIRYWLLIFLAIWLAVIEDCEAVLDSWREAMIAARAARNGPPQSENEISTDIASQLDAIARDFPLHHDWMLQDAGDSVETWLAPRRSKDFESNISLRLIGEIGDHDPVLRAALEQWIQNPGNANLWLELYERACWQRRALRLHRVCARWPRIVFTKHYTLGGSHYAYTEGQSDAQHERTFEPGSALCLLELGKSNSLVKTLIVDTQGVIRDPDVSWDGHRILFSWKKSDREDDYHLYEWEMGSGRVRQLTSDLGFADYEGAYLPGGGIVFNSTRCVQTVDCWWTEVSNLYTCDGNGKHLRRLTFDQVHDNFPTVMPDGRVIYTRWEYSDRGQLFVQGLFQMNPDGTAQSEFYGNNSWFPTSILHARGIPGTQKVMALFSGHHTLQTGKIGILDPARGRQENEGAQLAAPIRPTPAVRIDAYGQEGGLFQYPYPLDEQEFLAAYAPQGWKREPARFGLYWMQVDGRREWLASDPKISCNQPVPLAARTIPPHRSDTIDYRKTNGTFYIQDIYAGPGLAGVPRGTVDRVRVIALDYRAAGIGWNYNKGPAGDALVSTPVAIGNGSWDVKIILGDARVHADGSAFFTAPARTPLYFQAIDRRGYAIQTMRSWTLLQPGENASCVGCHESKNTAPLAQRPSAQALRAGPRELTAFFGPPRGFSFRAEIQPILDRHCIQCHPGPENSFNLKDTPVVEHLSKRRWSGAYLSLTHAAESELEGNRYLAGIANEWVNWISAQSEPSLLPPYSAGAAKSRLMDLLANGHRGVQLEREEIEKCAAWMDLLVPFCGSYTEANTWTPEEIARYQHFVDKRKTMQSIEHANLESLLQSAATSSSVPIH